MLPFDNLSLPRTGYGGERRCGFLGYDLEELAHTETDQKWPNSCTKCNEISHWNWFTLGGKVPFVPPTDRKQVGNPIRVERASQSL